MDIMKCTLKQITDDIEMLVSRVKARENAADSLRQQIIMVQSDLLSMRRYQEEVKNFHELSEKLSNHPKGPLILSLAAENKQLEQLKLENKTLCNSLDEHQTAMDLIMSKYRIQMMKLMQASHLESLMKSAHSVQSKPSEGVTSNKLPISDVVTADLNTRDPSTISQGAAKPSAISHQMSTLAGFAQDVCDRGETYATQLETELIRLRTENTGLREMLLISSGCSLDASDESSSTNAGNHEPAEPADHQEKFELRNALPKPPFHFSNPETFPADHPKFQVVSGEEFSIYATSDNNDFESSPNRSRSDDEDDALTVIDQALSDTEADGSALSRYATD